MAEPLNLTPEQRVRARIRRTFSQRTTGRRSMKAVEDQVLKLIKDYCAAPADEKEKVYARGEQRLLRFVK